MELRRNHHLGFSLPELLLALLILIIISTFTIPKIVQAQQATALNSVMKETIATLSQVYYLGNLEGQNNTTGNLSYVRSRLNYLKHCPSDNIAEGCFTINPAWVGYGGFKLPNGAGVVLWSYYSQPCNSIVIDANGDEPPNAYNQDKIFLVGCWQSASYNGQQFQGGKLQRELWGGGIGMSTMWDTMWE